MTENDRLLRREEVEKRTGRARATLYRKMRSGSFPLPLKISERAVRWRSSDIEKYIESRPLATGDAAVAEPKAAA